MGGYQEEMNRKQRRQQFGRRFRLSDAEERALKEEHKQNLFIDNIRYKKSLKRK